ncbi:hypothetical protein EXS57_02240 [Candidatus Kaiserbacteria bacterium]|nr:hypothetical protein [Candidatus Kaiserbacteria bacterium]
MLAKEIVGPKSEFVFAINDISQTRDNYASATVTCRITKDSGEEMDFSFEFQWEDPLFKGLGDSDEILKRKKKTAARIILSDLTYGTMWEDPEECLGALGFFFSIAESTVASWQESCGFVEG